MLKEVLACAFSDAYGSVLLDAAADKTKNRLRRAPKAAMS